MYLCIVSYVSVYCRYGDTTPRSIQARMFGLVWIVVGVTIQSVFTATVTTVLTQQSLDANNRIQGERVHTLRRKECQVGLEID